MVIRLAVVCLMLAAFAAGFAALVSSDAEKFVSLDGNNRCAFELSCNPQN